MHVSHDTIRNDTTPSMAVRQPGPPGGSCLYIWGLRVCDHFMILIKLYLGLPVPRNRGCQVANSHLGSHFPVFLFLIPRGPAQSAFRGKPFHLGEGGGYVIVSSDKLFSGKCTIDKGQNSRNFFVSRRRGCVVIDLWFRN